MAGIIGNGLIHASGLYTTLAQLSLGAASFEEDGFESADPVWVEDAVSSGEGMSITGPNTFSFDIEMFESTADVSFWDYQQELVAGNSYTLTIQIQMLTAGPYPDFALLAVSVNGASYDEDFISPDGSVQTLQITFTATGGTPMFDQDMIFLYAQCEPTDSWAGDVQVHSLSLQDNGPA